MKALVYHGPGKIAWDEKPKPLIHDPSDAIVRVTTTTICGTDLHILKGDLPSVSPGRTLGHEGVGIVESCGAAVTNFRPGDRVLISCITSCGNCEYCRKAMFSHCAKGGWILGNTVDGCQAEFVRIPFADSSLHMVPTGADEEAMVMLSDIMPTGYECGVHKGRVKPGDTVAIIGSGPVGLAALICAGLYSPAVLIVVDNDDSRLAQAREFGATHTFGNADNKAAEKILELTKGAGVDVAIEAVGMAATLELCQYIIAVGGHIANIGVHGTSAVLDMERLWDRGITLTTQLVDTSSIPMLLKLVMKGRLEPQKLASHRFELKDMAQAYEAFGHAAKTQALKVILKSQP